MRLKILKMLFAVKKNTCYRGIVRTTTCNRSCCNHQDEEDADRNAESYEKMSDVAKTLAHNRCKGFSFSRNRTKNFLIDSVKDFTDRRTVRVNGIFDFTKGRPHGYSSALHFPICFNVLCESGIQYACTFANAYACCRYGLSCSISRKCLCLTKDFFRCIQHSTTHLADLLYGFGSTLMSGYT